MPVIQCPTCQRKLNLKQMPAASRIKCPGCSNAIPIPTARKSEDKSAGKSAGKSAPVSASQAGLTPDDENFDFGKIQFPSAGPATVSTFQPGPEPLNVYQGPIPGDPLGEQMGVNEQGQGTAVSPGKKKKKGNTISPKWMAAILAGVFVFVLIVVAIATVFATKDDSGGDAETGTNAVSTESTE